MKEKSNKNKQTKNIVKYTLLWLKKNQKPKRTFEKYEVKQKKWKKKTQFKNNKPK